jgi:hypothetical protein
MADKEDDDVELIETGEEGKLVDDENKLNNDSIQKNSVGKDDDGLEEEEEGENTADLDEEHEEDGEEEGEEGEDNDIVYTNVDDASYASTKQGFIQKLKRKLGIRPKVHSIGSVDDESTVMSVKYVPPPAPHNMPSARDAAKARIYRREKVRYGKQKMEYYLEAMRNDTLLIDDLIMRSEQNKEYVKGH